MPLAPGTRLGSFDISARIGVGGMGEVYRATDLELKRQVAIKVLTPALAGDPSGLARFQREAEALASLSHPNIAAIYGLQEAGDSRALVMELVEGPTLAERIAQGRLRLDEALRIATQIVDALDAAHERGVVHRDLKPANIKVRPDGTVKVLDFGLAKLVSPDGRADLAATHTTADGLLLGTPAYMAPEQARGETVGTSVDIWAFGVVMFEMLTGRNPFSRPSVAATLAAILHEDPDWNEIPLDLRPLVRGTLQKDPRRRLRDIADARLLISAEPAAAAAPARPAGKGRVGWAVAGLLGVIAAGAAWPASRPEPPAAQVRFQIAPTDLHASAPFAVSPNGRHLAFIARASDGPLRVWVRDLDSLTERPLAGTEVGLAAPPPFWSPDSRFIAFDGGGKLKKIDLNGGLAETLCDLVSPAIEGSWNRGGDILVGAIDGGILRVSERGGTPAPVTVVDRSDGEFSHLSPVFLADGRRFLYMRVWRRAPERTGVFVGSLDVKPEDQDRRRVLATPTSVRFVPSKDAHGTLLFLREGSLMAQPFDERRLELSGAPRVVADRVDAYRDVALVSASDTGALVYRSAANLRLVWRDRQGRPAGELAHRGQFRSLSLSSDGTRALVSTTSQQVASRFELWVLDLARDSRVRLTPTTLNAAVWSPDASRIAFDAGGGLFIARAGGSEPPAAVLAEERGYTARKSPTSWSSDGRVVLYTVTDLKTGSDIWAIGVDGTETPRPFLRSAAAESQGTFSPDQTRQTWVAYTSNETGRDEVFVREFPSGAQPMMISDNGGHSPKWRGDGRELFYVGADGSIMVVDFVDARAGRPKALFKMPPGFASSDATGSRMPAPWGVAPDGQRFLFATTEQESGVTPLTVVLNWHVE